MVGPQQYGYNSPFVSSEYARGYGDGHRDGYSDGKKERSLRSEDAKAGARRHAARLRQGYDRNYRAQKEALRTDLRRIQQMTDEEILKRLENEPHVANWFGGR